MPTSKDHTHDQDGPITLRLDLGDADVRVIANTNCTRASVGVATDDDSGPFADAVNGSELHSDGQVLRVYVPRTGASSSTAVSAGGVTNIASGGARVGMQVGSISGGSVFDQRGQRVTGGQYNSVGPLNGGSGVLVTVVMPAGSTIEARSTGGDVRTVGGPFGPVQVRSDSGDVDIENAESVDVRTDSGDVEVEGARSSVRVRSISGDIWVCRASAPINVKTTSGDIELTQLTPQCIVKVATVSGDIECPSGVAAELNTVTGEIDRSEVVRPA